MKHKVSLLGLLLILPACMANGLSLVGRPSATTTNTGTNIPSINPSVTVSSDNPGVTPPIPSVQATHLATSTPGEKRSPKVAPTPYTSIKDEFLVTIAGEEFSIIRGDKDNVLIFWKNGVNVFFKKFNSAGAALTDAVKINVEITTMPQVASDSSGNFILAWTKYPYPYDSGNEIYIHRFDNNGNPLGTVIKVNIPYEKKGFASLNLAMNKRGEFVLSWVEYTYPQPETSFTGYEKVEMMILKFGPTGGAQNQINVINLDFKYPPQYGKLGIDNEGNYVVVWNDRGSLNLRRYDKIGNIIADLPKTINTRGNSTELIENSFHNLAMNDKGEFVLTWLSQPDPKISSLIPVFKIFSANLTPISHEIGLHYDLNTSIMRYPVSLAIDENNNFYAELFAYNRNDKADAFGNIYLMKHSEKDQQDTFTRVNNYVSSNSRVRTDLVLNSNNDLFVTWLANEGIYFKKFE
jgi:hypothetical protein